MNQENLLVVPTIKFVLFRKDNILRKFKTSFRITDSETSAAMRLTSALQNVNRQIYRKAISNPCRSSSILSETIPIASETFFGRTTPECTFAKQQKKPRHSPRLFGIQFLELITSR